MYATANIVLDERRMKMKTGKFPVKLRVVFKGNAKDYATIYDLSKTDYEKLTASRVSDDLQKIRDKLKELRQSVELALKEISPFGFEDFEKEFVRNSPSLRQRKIKETVKENVSSFEFDSTPYLQRFTIFKEDHSRHGSMSTVFLTYIIKLLEEDSIGTALVYQDAFNWRTQQDANPGF